MTFEQLQDIRDQKKIIGDAGEDFALRYELQRLQSHPLNHLVRLAGRSDIGLGYDILSLEGQSSTVNDRYIEVKTYSGQPHFFLSQSEHAAALRLGTNYYVYLIDINRIGTPGYEPSIIRDPANTLASNPHWNERIQNREYTLIDSTDSDVTTIADDDIILAGCFNDNHHLSWILSHKCYNVRYRSSGYGINGSISNNDVSRSVTRLLLYNIREPRTYSLYSVSESAIVNRETMINLGYSNPHSQQYILYHLTGKLPTPSLDIMQLLRISNDKLNRTSGTPIYVAGSDIRRFLLKATVHAATAPKRIYTNAGKPWTEVQTQQVAAMYRMGTAVAVIAKRMLRDADEIHARLQYLGLE